MSDKIIHGTKNKKNKIHDFISEEDQFLRMSASELAYLIKSKKITSLQVVTQHVNRLKSVNPIINAVVKDRYDLALKEAKKMDAMTKTISANKLPPLHGVPCTVKENFAVTGMPNAAGSVSRQHITSDHDATVVKRIRRAGAIVLGVTNTSELCLWMESVNRVYGRTNNPYDPTRIVGGSSGGEGAVVASGGSPFGIGSDIGGSIRLPSFFNGVFGHKPSGGLVPNSGQYPETKNESAQFLATGPICRKAEDLWPLLKILSGPDDIDTGCKNFKLKTPKNVKIKKLRVFLAKDSPQIRASKELHHSVMSVAQKLHERGAEIHHLKITGFEKALQIWASSLAHESHKSFRELLKSGAPVSLPKEILKFVTGKSDHHLISLSLVFLENILSRMPRRTDKFYKEGQKIRKQLSEEIGEDGILLFPPYPTVAPKHKIPLLMPFGWVNTAFFNIMKFPVTQVPLGLNSKGLPLGVQIISISGNDHVTIAIAEELEKIFGGWVWPHQI